MAEMGARGPLESLQREYNESTKRTLFSYHQKADICKTVLLSIHICFSVNFTEKQYKTGVAF